MFQLRGKLVAKYLFQSYEAFGALTNVFGLLFYSCILGASDFCEYCRNNDNVVVMPLLEMLYQASARTQNQIMMLIVLLIMSQGETFNANVHKIQIPQQIFWYKREY